jgi:starch synthase
VVQKGIDLLEQIAGKLSERNVAVVALGTGDPAYEKFFRDWAFWNKANVAVRIGYNEALAHKIEAGADIFLMPSRYEPCGLNQIYSLKYGTVPVVRATGGLDDTIAEWNPQQGTGTGFKFQGFSAESLLAAITRALAAFEEKSAWKKLMLNGMARNYSWAQPARDYAALYKKAAKRRA